MTSASDPNPHVNHDLTSVLPRKRAGLSASGEIPRRTLDREWTIVAPGRVVPPPSERPDLMVVDAPTAVVQCLSSVLDGRHRWRALGIPQMRSELICGVQLVDAFRHSTGVECDAVRAAAKNRIAAARLSTVLDLSDGGAESPMETVLRLLVLECLPPGYRWVSQLDLGRGRWGGTAPDLACPELKIALCYDGASHDSPDVRARDKAIDRQLESEGWPVLRFNRADIGVASVRRAVRAAVQVALDLLRMPGVAS
ncbi:endonuclease domain-containing protein [Corynebacterium variabile]|uniref:endonuclease domain-containing protein n=1 Tax=Corynebacterium variabile TaxID=1727 RepID=UPI003F9A801A